MVEGLALEAKFVDAGADGGPLPVIVREGRQHAAGDRKRAGRRGRHGLPARARPGGSWGPPRCRAPCPGAAQVGRNAGRVPKATCWVRVTMHGLGLFTVITESDMT